MILVAVTIHFLWGGNPVAVKFSLEVFPPLWTGFLRFLVASCCVGIWAHFRGVGLWPSRHEWPALLLIGGLFAVQIALMNTGFDRTGAAMGSVLIATNPLFAVFFTHLLVAGDRLNARRSLGLALAMAGTCVTLLWDVGPAGMDLVAAGNWLVLLSALLLGLRLALSARALKNMDETRVVLWQMLIPLPLFAIGGALTEDIRWDNLGWKPLAGLAYQGVVVAGIGFTTMFYLIRRYTPSVIMSFNFVSPMAGVLLAGWLLDESLGASVLLGMALVALGLTLVARPDAG